MLDGLDLVGYGGLHFSGALVVLRIESNITTLQKVWLLHWSHPETFAVGISDHFWISPLPSQQSIVLWKRNFHSESTWLVLHMDVSVSWIPDNCTSSVCAKLLCLRRVPNWWTNCCESHSPKRGSTELQVSSARTFRVWIPRSVRPISKYHQTDLQFQTMPCSKTNAFQIMPLFDTVYDS